MCSVAGWETSVKYCMCEGYTTETEKVGLTQNIELLWLQQPQQMISLILMLLFEFNKALSIKFHVQH